MEIRRVLAVLMGSLPVAGFVGTIFGMSSPSQDDEQTELRAVSAIRKSRQAVIAGGGALRDVLRGLIQRKLPPATVKFRATLSMWQIGPDGTSELIQTA